MGRGVESFSAFVRANVWTFVFFLHTVAEILLGMNKLRGHYKFEAMSYNADLKSKKGSKRRAQRVKLIQYTTYHGLARMSLGLLGACIFVFGVDSNLRTISLVLAFWHTSASIVPIVNLSRYEDVAKIPPTFLLHAFLGLCFGYVFWNHDTLVDDDFVVGWK